MMQEFVATTSGCRQPVAGTHNHPASPPDGASTNFAALTGGIDPSIAVPTMLPAPKRAWTNGFCCPASWVVLLWLHPDWCQRRPSSGTLAFGVRRRAAPLERLVCAERAHAGLQRHLARCMSIWDIHIRYG